MRIIIGALSAWKYPERRVKCNESWLRRAEAAGVPVVYLFASETIPAPEQLGPRAVVCPTPRDHYDYLPPLTRGFCQWALQRDDWDYLFKCDDDTYVSIPRLLALDAGGRDYIGNVTGPLGPDNKPLPATRYASGGAGYLLSRRAAAIVAEQLIQARGSEDLLVGQVLRAAGIPVTVDPRFVLYATKALIRPQVRNDLITTHASHEAFLLAAGEGV